MLTDRCIRGVGGSSHGSATNPRNIFSNHYREVHGKVTAKAIAGSRIDSTAPRSGRNCHCATFARFSEPGDFRVFQHNPPWAVVHSI